MYAIRSYYDQRRAAEGDGGNAVGSALHHGRACRDRLFQGGVDRQRLDGLTHPELEHLGVDSSR